VFGFEGVHTFGRAQCRFFNQRMINFSGCHILVVLHQY